MNSSELDTPALCLDLNVMQANMDAMANWMAARGKQWRPHVKCHKAPQIAHMQIERGAIGVTSAKLSEAEIFIDAGIEDVLIAHLVVGEKKLERLAALCGRARPIVCCDHYAQAEAFDSVCRRRGVKGRVLVEVNIGMNRVGVRPGSDARDLVRGIARLRHLELAGIMGYEGHLLQVPDRSLKQKRILSALSILEELRDQMLQDGLCCDIVSAGGTGSYQISCDHPAVTEIQAGGGIFGDPFYRENCGVTGLNEAVKIIATVVSRPKLERAVLDIGRKSVHPDVFPPRISRTALGRPLDDALFESLNAEHATLTLGPQSQDLVIGDKVEVVPGYCDFTTPLHEQFFILQDDAVAATWPIAARGKLQ